MSSQGKEFVVKYIKGDDVRELGYDVTASSPVVKTVEVNPLLIAS